MLNLPLEKDSCLFNANLDDVIVNQLTAWYWRGILPIRIADLEIPNAVRDAKSDGEVATKTETGISPQDTE